MELLEVTLVTMSAVWRLLVEAATGVFTGSFYTALRELSADLWGEARM